ncbi:MAG: 4-alpha-glucanotransferase [Bacteroidetes bacterium]|nr:4-alpha-glucanotransferase [Bacteroidota bacterium]
MKITFQIHYKTQWGQGIGLIGGHNALGAWQEDALIRLAYAGNDLWTCTIDVEENALVEYKYLLIDQHNQLHWEGGENRHAGPFAVKQCFLHDTWQATHNQAEVMYSKVFTEVVFKPSAITNGQGQSQQKGMLQLRLKTPRIGHGQGVGVIGNTACLGLWNKPVLLSNAHYPLWTADLPLDAADRMIRYKYVIINLSNNEIISWEKGDDRQISLPDDFDLDSLFVCQDTDLRYDLNPWKGAGLAVPVFSLRSQESFGVGEFNDLKKLVDWCAITGLKMIQILPINETVATHSWLDSYPYKSISVKALHPMYLNLKKMGVLDDDTLMREFEQKKVVFNQLPHVDYVDVTRTKARYFKLIFDQNWSLVSRKKSYKKFFSENKDWLVPYAAFCYLRDKFKTSNFRLWEGFAAYDPQQIASLTDPTQPFHEHIAVHYFIQYHLDIQLTEAVDYAHKKRIGLKGDIPIGISPDSVEAWTEPMLFNLAGQAGAPPDDFAIMGQNWGFPTYNWDEMAKDGFAWWRGRLRMMEKYFDAYRIDHILGFFRIWEIPQHALHGLLGYFKPGLPVTAAECEKHGIWFDHDRFVKPYIREHFLRDFFGDFTEEVRKNYLNETDYNVFELKPAFDTQKKIHAHFTPEGETRNITLKEIIIRDGLMGLLDEVLFIRDPNSDVPAYHPRIALHYTYTYRDLDQETRNKLNELYIHFFYRRHEQFWKEQAMAKLPGIVQASKMLVCGEDLGMVPQTVAEVMKQLNILSLEIQRMPKNPRVEFGHPDDAPYLSVCTTSTHDMSTIRGWWEEDREKTRRFYHSILGHNDITPFFAEPWLCQEIIRQHLHSPAMWTIFPIQDLIAMDGTMRWDQTDKERINVPSNPENKWQYRMILSLENLLHAKSLNKLIHDMVHLSGRDTAY